MCSFGTNSISKREPFSRTTALVAKVDFALTPNVDDRGASFVDEISAPQEAKMKKKKPNNLELIIQILKILALIFELAKMLL